MDAVAIDSAPTGGSTADVGSGSGDAPSDFPLAAAAVHSPSARMSQFAESRKLERQFLMVPLEQLKKTIRTNHRAANKELTAVLAGVAESADRAQPLSRDDAVAHLTSLDSRLQALKLELEEGCKKEGLEVQRCRARLNHLEALDDENFLEWGDIRLKRFIVDYMLRMRYYNSAEQLAEKSNIQDLVDIDIFVDLKNIIDSLHKKEVSLALNWCAENRARLKKSKSTFEFLLRRQEFIELVRAGEKLKAITYAQKYLAPFGTSYPEDLQRALATLVVKPNTELDTYKVLFEGRQWDELVWKFIQEFSMLFGFTDEILLNIYLHAGLSVLKTPFSYEAGCTKEDPLSQEGFRKLSEPLPFCKHEHSKLICYITKELMDHENPPMVLPNGYVYSFKAMEEMAMKNDGKITCPRTGEVCNYSDLVKAYV